MQLLNVLEPTLLAKHSYFILFYFAAIEKQGSFQKSRASRNLDDISCDDRWASSPLQQSLGHRAGWAERD